MRISTIWLMGREVETGAVLPLIQYWHSEKVPTEVEAMTETFHDLNPDLHHRLFDEQAAERFIAEHYTPREVAAFRACAVPAMQADYFRYCAVLALGGVYVDVDFYCLQPLRTLVERTAGGLLIQSRPPLEHLINGLFAFNRPGHPLLKLTLDVATCNIERRRGHMVNMVTGPWIFTALAALHKAGSADAFRRGVEHPALKPLVEGFLDVAGDYRHVKEAFADVQVTSFHTAMSWIGIPSKAPAYKHGDDHWVGWHRRREEIYR